MVAAARRTIRATPKSAIFATISEFRRTFRADKSRWMTGAQKLDDVRVSYGAHQLALSHELGRRLGQPSLQDCVDGFGGGSHGKGHLVHLAIGPFANGSASELDIGENERPQFGMVTEKILLHFFPCFRSLGTQRSIMGGLVTPSNSASPCINV